MTNPSNQTAIGGLSLEEIIAVLADHEPNIEPSERAARHAAVAMILRAREAGGAEALFIQRAQRDSDPWSGQMAFPGGRRDPSDPTLEATARRETREEVGLVLEPKRQFARLHDIEGGRLRSFDLSVSPFLYHTQDSDRFTFNEEVADAVWVPLEYLGNPANIQTYRFELDPFDRLFPSFHFDRYIIWGLTFRIIASFMEQFGISLPGEPKVTDVE